jgi:uncharacterized protein
MTTLPAALAEKLDRLLALLGSYGSCAVAMSAGVDSTVLAKAARLALGDRALAVTGTSASLAEGELDEARTLAEQIGIRHEILATDEMSRSEYTANAPDRCYHCKSELYARMQALVDQQGIAVVAGGTNADDAGDYRPGTSAAAQQGVRSPLAECGIGKEEIRQLAKHWGLPIWDKPATPCLSSRIAYGVEVTPERLARIDRAEQILRCLGLRTLRVRYHEGDLARLEVPVEAIADLCEPATRRQLVAQFKSLGFRYVTLDLEGFRSGSQNAVLPLDVLRSQH